MTPLMKFSGYTFIISAICLGIWWLSSLSDGAMISNIFLLLTLTLASISFGAVYCVFMGRLKNFGIVLFCVLMTGSILMGGIVFFELLEGPIYTNILFLVGLTISLFLVVLNFILFGFVFWNLGIYPATALLCFIIGAVILTAGLILTPIRYYIQGTGVIILIFGMIQTGLRNLHG